VGQEVGSVTFARQKDLFTMRRLIPIVFSENRTSISSESLILFERMQVGRSILCIWRASREFEVLWGGEVEVPWVVAVMKITPF